MITTSFNQIENTCLLDRLILRAPDLEQVLGVRCCSLLPSSKFLRGAEKIFLVKKRTRFTMRSLMLLLWLVGRSQAIYSDDHWDYSTKLTEDNFDEFITSNIDQDKTVFVRWIGGCSLSGVACNTLLIGM